MKRKIQDFFNQILQMKKLLSVWGIELTSSEAQLFETPSALAITPRRCVKHSKSFMFTQKNSLVRPCSNSQTIPLFLSIIPLNRNICQHFKYDKTYFTAAIFCYYSCFFFNFRPGNWKKKILPIFHNFFFTFFKFLRPKINNKKQLS
jgi:hypothetical protein